MYSVIVDKILPEALTMGVGYDEFWYFTPKDLQPFVKAFNLTRKRFDEQAWVQGSYIRLAVASCLTKDVKYPDKPCGIKHITVSPTGTINPIKDKFLHRMVQINSRFKED